MGTEELSSDREETERVRASGQNKCSGSFGGGVAYSAVIPTRDTYEGTGLFSMRLYKRGAFSIGC